MTIPVLSVLIITASMLCSNSIKHFSLVQSGGERSGVSSILPENSIFDLKDFGTIGVGAKVAGSAPMALDAINAAGTTGTTPTVKGLIEFSKHQVSPAAFLKSGKAYAIGGGLTALALAAKKKLSATE
jgi:hypothetical protein